jgi:uncharacterized metal-binding protein YceD (DUF177 family)
VKQVPNELSRPLPVDRVPANGCYERVAAEPAECAAVARRLDVPRIYALSALVKADPWRRGLKVSGTLNADLERQSVVSLELFRQSLRHDFVRYFMPADAKVPEEAEDIDLIEHGIVDLGEIVVETLALELDPYPRKAGERFDGAGDSDAPDIASPFGALAALKPGEN